MKEIRKLKQYVLTFAAVMLFMVCVFPKQVCAASILNKYKDAKIYDVTDYGADKTGKKSIDAAMQSLLSTVRKDIIKGNLDGKRGALIYFPKGTFKSTSLITIREGMSIAAEENTTVKFSGKGGLKMYASSKGSIEGGNWISSQKEITILCSNSNNVKIKNLKIQSGFMGIKIAGGSAEIENVNVSKCLKIGLSMTRAKVTVKKSKFNNNGQNNKIDALQHGVGVYDNSKLTISDSEMNKNRKFGISLRKSELVMKKCKMYENGRHALDTDGVCNINMTSCDIYKNGYKDIHDGIILGYGSTGKFVDCKFRSNAVSGILVNNTNTKASFKGCTFSGNGAHNIYAQNTNKGKVSITIDGCSFSKCKSGESVRFYVTRKTGYSLNIKGKNTYKNVKPKYTFWINGKYTYKN